jgi:hypothetical protein
VLPEPTVQRVTEEINGFDQKEEFVETTVKQLFDAHKGNTSKYEVLAKIIVLNQLYSARVLNKHALDFAGNIAKSSIDMLLDKGSADAVNTICGCCSETRYYSFATKYCSWHKPDLYCMWDGYVDQALWDYNKRYTFSKFKRFELRSDYTVLRRVIGEFRDRFGLQSFNFKGIDKYLWSVGYVSGTTDPSSGAERIV